MKAFSECGLNFFTFSLKIVHKRYAVIDNLVSARDFLINVSSLKDITMVNKRVTFTKLIIRLYHFKFIFFYFSFSKNKRCGCYGKRRPQSLYTPYELQKRI